MASEGCILMVFKLIAVQLNIIIFIAYVLKFTIGRGHFKTFIFIYNKNKSSASQIAQIGGWFLIIKSVRLLFVCLLFLVVFSFWIILQRFM